MDDGLSLGHTKTTLNEETVPLGSDRAYMGLVAEWLMMLTSQTKNKITVTLETDQIAQMAHCFPTGTYLLKAARPQDSRPLATRPRDSPTG